MPYCATESKPDFHTKVTSQALVACSLHDRKADTALPPTTHEVISFGAMMVTPEGTGMNDGVRCWK